VEVVVIWIVEVAVEIEMEVAALLGVAGDLV
jgi:hypothetical protein